ncbi:MAG: hypothetical protein AAFP20_03345 [Cyanobacteria bacterium J06614_10]
MATLSGSEVSTRAKAEKLSKEGDVTRPCADADKDELPSQPRLSVPTTTYFQQVRFIFVPSSYHLFFAAIIPGATGLPTDNRTCTETRISQNIAQLAHFCLSPLFCLQIQPNSSSEIGKGRTTLLNL